MAHIIRLKQCGSTNDEARKLYKCGGRDIVVIAGEQSNGRGRFERTFKSERGGAYFTVVTSKGGFSAETATDAVQLAGRAVQAALAEFGVETTLKWPNDVTVGGKKICGILCETIFEVEQQGGLPQFKAVMIGIGVNVHNPVCPELADIMTTLQKEAGAIYAPALVIDNVLKHLFDKLDG